MPSYFKKKVTPNAKGPLEEAMYEHIINRGLVEGEDFIRNANFIEGRRYTGDFVFEKIRMVLEIDGAEFTGQGHTSGVGYTSDREKDALAFINGWLVVRVSGSQVNGGDIKRYNKKRVNNPKATKRKGNTAVKIFDAMYDVRKQSFESGKVWLGKNVAQLDDIH